MLPEGLGRVRRGGRMALWLLWLGCVRGPIEAFTAGSVVPTAMRVPDVDRVCRTGGALGFPLQALPKRDPDRALVIAGATSAMCEDALAREATIRRWVEPRGHDGADQVALVRDLLERRRRHLQKAAFRYHGAWKHA